MGAERWAAPERLAVVCGLRHPHDDPSERAMLIPREAPPGEYRVLLGLYDGATGQRSPVLSGPAAGADHVVIAQVQVESPD